MRKRLLVLILAAFAALGPAALPAAADNGNGSSGDNAAVAVNLHDGASVFRFAFDITQTMSDVVDQTNAAVAYSSCSDCKTVALAVQIVLVASDPSVVQPENVALAVNYECTSCETFAAAYQFVVSTGGPVRFTAEGRQELAEIQRELRALIREDIPFDELKQRIDALMQRLKHVLETQLEPLPSQRGEGGDGKDGNSGSDGQMTTTEPADTTTTDGGTAETTPTDTTETATVETSTGEDTTTSTETTGTDTTGTTTTGG